MNRKFLWLTVIFSVLVSGSGPAAASDELAWTPKTFWASQGDETLNRVLVYDEGQSNGSFLTLFDNNNFSEPYLGFSSYGSKCEQQDILCVESVEVEIDGVSWRASQVEVLLVGGEGHGGNQAAAIPRSTGVGIWQLASSEFPGQKHSLMVNLSLGGGYLEKSRKIVDNYTRLDLSASFVEATTVDPEVYWGQCALNNSSVCYLGKEFPKDTKISLVVRAPKYVGGWFYGRVADFNLSVDSSNPKFNRVAISGEKSRVQAIDYSFEAAGNEVLTRSLWKSRNPTQLSNLSVRLAGWVNGAVDAIEASKLHLQDTASGDYDAWSISTASESSRNSCLSDTSKILGLVSTNALGYSREIPKFRDGYFSYPLASLRNDSEGNLFLGRFEFVMRSEVARCLYGFTKAPVSATIQVLNDQGQENVATKIVSERDGWLKLAANGFTFSKKEIRAKLNQAGTPQSRTLSSFFGNGATLSSTQKAEIRALLVKSAGNSKFICTGIRYVSQPPSENLRVRARAKAACDYAKSINPGFSYFFQTKTTTARSFAGKVLILSK